MDKTQSDFKVGDLVIYENKDYIEEFNINEKVHIDHIIPLSTAKTIEDVIRLCDYKNLQLLKEKDNLEKGNSLDWSLKNNE